MTSPGLKRPLEYDTVTQTSGLSASGTSHKDATGGEANYNAVIKIESPNNSNSFTSPNNIASTNGTKRRCIANNNFNSYNNQQLAIATASQANQLAICSVANMNSSKNSPFKVSPSVLSSLSDNIAALIKDELQQASSQTDSLNSSTNDSNNGNPEPPILTARQTQAICEKLVKELEERLRDGYDKILARKLAEQYDVFAQANYLSSFVDPSRRMPQVADPSMTTPPNPTPGGAPSNTSINAFAAALQMQRSMTAAAAQSRPVTSTPNSITDLNHLAASLAVVNGHTSTIPSTPHHHPLSYNSFQQQAAAAAAAAAAIQHQAAVHHHGHHQQQQIAQQSQHIGAQHRITSTSISHVNSAIAGAAIPSGPVLLSSNLDEQLATPEALFTLFGVFGDVVRVKILFNKKDNALIQMADATQAQVAQSYLDKQRIFGKIIRVTRSKHQLVQMPREGNQSDTGLTKDFTNSPLHRFKIPGSRNYLNIYPPSNTLHISNIPAVVDESDLRKAFKEQCGFEFTSFKFFPKDRKMALMKFASTEHATIALIKMHNFQISEENNLRVSFSKTLI